MATIAIDPSYGYVLLAAISTVFMNIIHTFNVGSFRKLAKVNYPFAYAPASRTDEAAHLFNCAQRAHANFIENHPTSLACILIGGLSMPKTAAGLGFMWSVGRYVYMKGYNLGGGGKGKNKGKVVGWLAQVGLLGLSVYSGLGLVMGW